MVIHVVSSGETIFSIARQYGVSPALLLRQNQVPPDGTLAVGQTLVVLFPAQTHTVQAGETLSGIAGAYGVDVLQLYRNNYFLLGQPAITPGEELVISLEEEKRGPIGANGYAYPYIDPALLSEQLPYMTYLTPFTYGVGANGTLVPLADEALLTAAPDFGVQPWMHLSTLTEEGSFSTERAQELLTDETLQTLLTAQVEATLRAKGYGGLDVDFEYLPPALADEYAAFIRRLRQQLNPQGWSVIVALAPKTSEGQKGLLYEAHNYAALGEAANAVLLMTYEWGYTYGPPMAVAPLPQVQQVLQYALSVIPAEKIFLGFPTYGYDWPLPFTKGVTRAQSISPQEALALARQYGAAIRYDGTAQAPWFRYTAPDGTEHEVWFEDARSSLAKFDLVTDNGLQGVGFWNLMRQAPQTMLVMNALFDIEKLL